MRGAIKIYTNCIEEDKESGLGVKNRRAGRCEGTQELRCSTVARPRDQIFAALSCLRQLQPGKIFAQNLATLCALCALCAAGTRCSGSKIRPGAALLHCERYCVREERALLHSWARQCTLCGTVRCAAERRCRAVCRAVCRPLQPAAAHCSCTPTPPLQ